MVGSKIGNYLILAKIGEGGAGEVWKARDCLLGRIVALKAIREDFAFQPQVIERFRTEARTLARLNHPNVATLHSLLEEDARQLMVMEFVDGQTLASLVRSAGRLPPEQALPIFYQALAGIGYAHESGIVHRDLKSSNLMVTALGVVKIMDFGIARALGSDRVTRHGHVVGTLHYVAPEQVRGEESDARSDLYSLGVVLFQLLTGRLPFEGSSDYELMRAHVETPPPRPRDLAPEIPPEVEAVVLRALAKRPEERWPCAQELRDALAAASGIPATARPLPLPALRSPGPGPADRAVAGDAEATPGTRDAPTAELGRDESPTRERTTAERAAPRFRRPPAAARRPLAEWGQRTGAVLAFAALALGVGVLLSEPVPTPPPAGDEFPATPWPAADLAAGFGPPYVDAAGEVWPGPPEAPAAEPGETTAEAEPFAAFLGASFGKEREAPDEPGRGGAPRAARGPERRRGERGWIIRR